MRKDLNAGGSLRAVMQQHHLALEQAIRQLAQAVGNHPPERAEIALFFQELIDGGWDAYEEATAHESEELRKEDREILQLQEHAQLAVRHKARKNTGSMIVVKKFSAEFQVQFVPELGDTFPNTGRLHVQIFFVVKSNFHNFAAEHRSPASASPFQITAFYNQVSV